MLPASSPEQQACGELLEVISGDFVVDTPLQQLVAGTVARSRQTFDAIAGLLQGPFAAQAAMLSRALFEDVIIAHWLVLNEDDPHWLVHRFFRHRDAMALHQARVAAAAQMRMGEPITPDPDSLRSRQNALFSEFGGEAQKNWWDPGEEGGGKGRPIGLSGIVQRLEQVAARRERFNPRFAGGAESILTRLHRVAEKWFSQYLHHTALGLPIQPQPTGQPTEAPENPWLVLFVAYWLFAQQGYLVHEFYGRDLAEFEEVFYDGLVNGFHAPKDLVVRTSKG